MSKGTGEKILSIRQSMGMTQQAFGDLFNATRSNVSKWEKGSSLPNNERLKSISDLGNITVDKLLNSNPLEQYTKQELLNELLRRETNEQIPKDHD